jgi:hypothetical protein
MQVDHAQQKCQHDGCQCVVANDHRFCSDQCRLATQNGTRREAECPCGHAECKQSSPSPDKAG